MSLWDDYTGSNFNPLNMLKREDPTKGANRYLDQIPGVGQKYYGGYIDRGNRAGAKLEGEYGKLMNPTSFIDDIMKNYSTSQGAQYQQKELGRGIGATAASGGYAGTPEHQKEYGNMASDIMSKDMQQYLQNALGVYGTGLSGEQNFDTQGFNASGSMADLLGGKLSSQAGLSFQNSSQNNANRNAFMNAIMKALSTGGGVATGKPSTRAVA